MLLTGCLTTTKTQYVKPVIPALPPKPAYYPVVFDNDLRLSEDSARALLKNRELDEDRTRQLEAIIEGLR